MCAVILNRWVYGLFWLLELKLFKYRHTYCWEILILKSDKPYMYNYYYLFWRYCYILRYSAICDPNVPFFFSEIGHSTFFSLVQRRKKRESTVPQKYVIILLSHILIISGTQKNVQLSIVSYILWFSPCASLASHCKSPPCKSLPHALVSAFGK